MEREWKRTALRNNHSPGAVCEVKRGKVRKGKIQPQGGKWSIISNVREIKESKY